MFREFSDVQIQQTGGRFSVMAQMFRTSWIGDKTFFIWNSLGYLLDKLFPTDKVTLGYIVVAKK